MVQAILDGRKTQTRRVIKLPKGATDLYVAWGVFPCYPSKSKIMPEKISDEPLKEPYKPGDVLYVKEAWATHKDFADVFEELLTNGYYYKVDAMDMDWVDDCEIVRWRSPIFMPKEAARIFLRVTNVRIERLQDISEDDARAEGMESEEYLEYYEWAVSVAPPGSILPTIQSAFAGLWDKLNARRGYGWDTNPWVWVIEFERISKDEAYKKEGLK